MKKFNYVLALFFISLMAFSSCDKVNEITTLLGKVSAKIDGVAWSASTTDGDGIAGAVIAEGKFIITATSTDGKTLIIVVNGTEAGTSYDLKVLEGTATAATLYKVNVDDDDSEAYLSTDGSVTLTEKTDNRISGTFYFTAAKTVDDTVEITDGVFDNILYTSLDN